MVKPKAPALKAEGAPPVKLVKKKAEAKVASVKELREFGWLVGGLFLLLGLSGLHHGKVTGPYFTAIGSVLLVLGTVAPRALGQVHRLWMGLAEAMGKVMTKVILTVFYCVYMTPVAIVMRMLGKDALNLRIDRTATSYWDMRKNPTPSRGERLTQEF